MKCGMARQCFVPVWRQAPKKNTMDSCFYSGKVKKLSIHKDTLHIPDDAVGNSYSLVKVLSSMKMFWTGLSGVNSLDRRNLLHLLDGKEYGWCRPYTQKILTEKLLEKIQEKRFGKVSRSIADDLQ